MSKSKTIFACQECGYESQGWLGKCPACGQWNTFIEEIIPTAAKGRKTALDRDRVGETRAISIKDIEIEEEERYGTGINELDRVLGGGIVKGSIVLVGGDPGIGKSTLLLQVCDKVKLGDRIQK